MSKVRIYIDGKQVIADKAHTILQVCREQGINIPTLCYDDQLEPFTSCFLCVVEVEGARTLIPSCGTMVQQGMRVTTDNDEVRKARKMALELILSNHYADCLGPCKLTCPAGVDVQGYLALAAMGKYREAVELIKKNNPLPTVCGRVCTRPCEMNCRRNYIDEPAAIDHVKRFIADIDLKSSDRYFPLVKPDSNHRVAIIGAGPAGLSCAYYLRQEGHHVDIFDAKSKAGGMLRWGIPQYRLPEDVIDKEVEGITQLGVEIFLNKALGKDFSLDDLFEKGYESVFLGLGAQASTSMNVENENSEGVLSGIDFLEDIKLGKIKELPGRVAVIGGGNTAMDAARSALRLGADKVTVVYRRTVKEMPANQLEIEEAQEEGVQFKFLTAPLRVTLNRQSRATGIECVQMELGEPDSSGRRRPVPIKDSNFVIDSEWIIAAIGQKPELGFAVKDRKLIEIRQTKWGTLEVLPDLMETNIPGVFAGGDVVLGAATAIEAIADGKKAAEAIHKYLTGEKLYLPKKPFISRKENFREFSAQDFRDFSITKREKMAARSPDKRKKDWEEIELGFTPEQVYHEALRCLECGCQAFYECDLQVHSTEYEALQKQYLGEFHNMKKDSSHPFIEIDLNKCILCGRCVRVCDKVMGLGIYGFVKRGFEAKVKPVLEMPLAETHCISCGQCVETCPTGAIIDKVDATKPGPWVLNKFITKCQYCGVGCSMQAEVLENRILKISADRNASVNEYGNLCQKGRYGFRYVNDEMRLNQPMIRINGHLEKVSWKKAIQFAAERIKKLRVQDVGWAVLGSPYATNEENYILQKFARIVLQTNNIGSFSHLKQYPESLLRASMSNTNFKRIEDSDFIMVCNFDPLETHPVLYIMLQKAIRSGQTVYMGCCPQSRLAKKSNCLNISDENKVLFLQYLVDMIGRSSWYEKVVAPNRKEKVEDIFRNVYGISRRMTLSKFGVSKKDFNIFFKKLLNSKKPLFICHRDNASPEIVHWLNSLGYILGQSESFLSMPTSVNFQGLLDMGVIHDYLPGYQRVNNVQVRSRISKLWNQEIPNQVGLPAWEAYQEFNSGALNGLILWNQDPVGTANLPLSNTENSFIMVADMFLTDTGKMADVVFPIMPFFEISGTFTNAEARLQHVNQIVKPLSNHMNWYALCEIAKYLKYSFNYKSSGDILREIRKIVPEYKKEFVIFRNGYIPESEILSEAKDISVPYGANYFEKWFLDYQHGEIGLRVSDTKNLQKKEKVLL